MFVSRCALVSVGSIALAADKISVEILPPASLRFLPGVFEVEQGDVITLFVALFDSEGRRFATPSCIVDQLK